MSLNEILTIAIPTIAAFIAGLVLHRIKSSLVKLQTKIKVQNTANSIEDDFWGNIQILHNNQRIDHLHFVRIDISNQSRKDIDNVIINIHSGRENRIISSIAMNLDTKMQLADTEAFRIVMEQGNRDYLDHNRELFSKVLNRKTVIGVELLVESNNDSLKEEDIVVSIEKKGVRLTSYKKIDADEWAIFFGILIVGLTSLITYFIYPESKLPIIILSIVGSVNIFLGMLIYYSLIGWSHWNDDD